MCIEHGCTSYAYLLTLSLILFIANDILSIDPYAVEWGITRINARNTNYFWTITNYSLTDKIFKFDDALESPIFSGDDSDKYQWQLMLYPKGINEKYKDGISLFLYSTNEVDSTASYRFYVINRNGAKTNFHSHTHTFRGAHTGFGWSSLILQSDLRDQTKNLLPNNTLTILMEITVNEGTTNISGRCKSSNNIFKRKDTGMKLFDSSFLSDVQLSVEDHVIKATGRF